jgi:hypothetical protein
MARSVSRIVSGLPLDADGPFALNTLKDWKPAWPKGDLDPVFLSSGGSLSVNAERAALQTAVRDVQHQISLLRRAPFRGVILD